MRIVRVITRMNVGGPAQHVAQLSGAFPDTLLVSGKVGEHEGSMDHLLNGNTSYWVLTSLGREVRPLADLRSIRYLLNILRWHEPDIIHTHTAKAGMVGRVAGMLYNVGRRRKAKLVHTFHGNVFRGYFGLWPTLAFKLIERALARHTDAIIAVSEGQKRELVEEHGIGDNGKVHVIPLGLPLERFAALEPPKFSRPLSVTFVGRLEAIKRPEIILGAVIVLLTGAGLGGRLRLTFVGDGPLRPSLEAHAAIAGVKDAVAFTGWVTDVPKVLEGVDVVVLTSRNEGTSVSAIEAMAAGRLVISTEVGGMRDLFGATVILKGGAYYDAAERGLLLKCSTEGAEGCLVMALMDVLNGNTFEEQRRAARGYVLRHHSSERLVGDMRRLYESFAR